jgi:single-stranded DNA-binding protein
MATNNSNSGSKNRTIQNRPSNYVILTLHAIADGETRFTNSGKVMAKVRAFLSQGKEKDSDEYKPSIFFDVMAFSKDENATPLTDAIANFKNKGLLTIKGRLAMDEWTGKDETKHQQLLVIASSVEPFSFDKNGQEEVEELEGEPA